MIVIIIDFCIEKTRLVTTHYVDILQKFLPRITIFPQHHRYSTVDCHMHCFQYIRMTVTLHCFQYIKMTVI